MAKKQAELDQTPEQVYNEHNHETAQASDARLQCQCKTCKGYRNEK